MSEENILPQQSNTPVPPPPPAPPQSSSGSDFVIPEVLNPIAVPQEKPSEVVIKTDIPTTPAQAQITAPESYTLNQTLDKPIPPQSTETVTTPVQKSDALSTPRPTFTPEHLMSQVHTLKTDMADVLSSGNSSVARIAIQEESDKKRDETRSKIEKTFRALVVVMIFVFVGGGLGILGYAVIKQREPKTAGVIVEQGPRALISSNTQTELDLTGMDQSRAREAFRTLIREKMGVLRPNTIEYVRLVRRVSDGQSTYVLEVPGSQAIRLTSGESSNRLTQALADPSFFGIHNGQVTSGFWILKTAAFQDSFSALLEWEKNMPRDLFPLLLGEDAPSDLIRKGWEDLVLQSTDLRVLKDRDGEIRMLYSFMGTTDTIFIGTNTEQFMEVFTRIKNPGPALQ